MNAFHNLQREVRDRPSYTQCVRNYLLYLGFCEHPDDPVPIARAYAVRSLLTGHDQTIYENDLIAGSIRGLLAEGLQSDEQIADSAAAEALTSSYGRNTFITNADHFAPDYESFLALGVGGVLRKIRESKEKWKTGPDSEKRQVFLEAAEIAMVAFGEMVSRYGDAARRKAGGTKDEACRVQLNQTAETCYAVHSGAPASFREALQLVWLAHTAFYYEGRDSMALGRLDQYLFPYYERDITAEKISREEALDMLRRTFFKIYELQYFGYVQIAVNICIGGVKRDNSDALNELSYVILEAVRDCNIPGPNLSARIHPGTPDRFPDECLKVIGTGLGYPALMNDGVNIPALRRHGYTDEDSRDYCMVGCIENFIPGRQPPWSDGRFNVPKCFEAVFNHGRCILTNRRIGVDTGGLESMTDMEHFMEAFERQITYAASIYMVFFRNENDRYNKEMYSQPFLSCFCRDCIERGLDINDGGSLYPSAHGACCVGIATVADSLAAIEEVIYIRKKASLMELRDAIRANFDGYGDLRTALLKAPKYGNNDDFADKYAVWFVRFTNEVFQKYRTRDGGPVYTAIASNVQNISTGYETAATPDGRLAGMPLSDAASPTYGMDKNGPTSVLNSLMKPDYTLVSCGTVVNQKYSPAMFTNDNNRRKLLSLIRAYFNGGGQEIQMNAVSREVLRDAMENPEEYRDLVVRVSGFSAYFTMLSKDIQNDILNRTEQW